ncbi:hypothetical protein WHU40_14520 [Escherichia coli]|uniref:hypothetical protein n=1 Tax=Escherichia coli TaxID=562 RepID=UPI0030CD0732
MKHQAKIYAVIVTFNPDIESLRKNLCSISEQVDRVVIIDNSNDSRLSEPFTGNDK